MATATDVLELLLPKYLQFLNENNFKSLLF